MKMRVIKVTILTEAGSVQGFGHLSRCCALYDESVALGYDTHLIVNTTVKLPEMQRNIIVADWLDLSVLMPLLHSSDYVIVDSYLADSNVYEIISDNCSVALYIDDYMRIDYPKGIVVNPSLYGNRLPYKKRENVQYLGGSDYIIVRPEFQNIIPKERNNDRNQILITMGGSDIINLTPFILKTISEELSAAKKHVVIGAGFSNIREIELAADDNTILHKSLSASQMRDLMLSVNVAVTAAGQTIYELMTCGVPIIAIKVIDNQKWNIMELQERGFICIDATERHFDISAISWKELIEKSQIYKPFSFCGQNEILKIFI